MTVAHSVCRIAIMSSYPVEQYSLASLNSRCLIVGEWREQELTQHPGSRLEYNGLVRTLNVAD